MLGIGLGGFMDGFNKSQDMLQKRDEAKRKQVLADRQTKEYDRLSAQRDAIVNINADAKATFDAQVSAGTQKPENFDTFWTNFALPKLKNTYLLNGDIESAKQVQEWGDQEDTKKGAKLFAGALVKAQTGDGAGALADVIEAGKLKGYINNGYEVLGQESFTTESGVPAYNIMLRTPDGKEVKQSVRATDLPKVIATFGNPQAAWESQVAARASEQKRKEELEDYKAKKVIDRQYGIGPTKERGDAITALRKREDGGLAGDETKFDDMPRDQQEKLISGELELQQGQIGLGGQGALAPAEKRVLVDPTPGKPVLSGSKPAADKPQAKEEPATKPQASAEKRIPGVPERAQAGVRSRIEELQRAAGQSAPGISPSAQEQALDQANDALEKGASIEEVAAGLHQAGVPEWQWPSSIQEHLRERQRSYGLNP